MINDIIGKINLNFSVLNDNDPKSIILADLSDWKILEDKPAVIRIVLPGGSKEIVHTWIKHKLNILNSINLGISCLRECAEQTYEDLPDGIYQFILEGSPTNYNKKRYYLKDDSLRIEISKIYIKADIEYSLKDKDLRNSLEDIEFMLKVAESHTIQGNFVKADKAFCEAQKLMRKHQDYKNCI